MKYLISGKTPRRNGIAHPYVHPQDVFACRDGNLVLAVGNDSQFAKFCEALGRPELALDERFAENQDRVRNRSILAQIIREELERRDRKDVVAALDRAGVPCGPINTIPEVFEDPQVKHREMLIEIPHPLADKVPLVASPMRFKEAPLMHDRAPPLLGEHTVDILKELNMDDAQIAELRAKEII